MCRMLPHTRCSGLWLACRAEAALVFLVQEAATHTGRRAEVGGREQRAADAERGEEEEAGQD